MLENIEHYSVQSLLNQSNTFCFALAKKQIVNKWPEMNSKTCKRIIIAKHTGFPRGKMHFFSVFCFCREFNFNHELNNFESIKTTGITISVNCFALCTFDRQTRRCT